MRVGICGTGGVGKSTLIKALKEYFEEKQYVINTEITRELKDAGYHINASSKNYNETQLLILGKHLSNLIERKMISDRCLIDGYAYTEYLCHAGKVDVVVRDAVANALEAGIDLYDIILYIPIEFETEDDGVRSTDDLFRRGVDSIIKTYLSEISVNRKNVVVYTITGNVEERIQKIKTIIENEESKRIR